MTCKEKCKGLLNLDLGYKIHQMKTVLTYNDVYKPEMDLRYA